MSEAGAGLYLHVPFCSAICPYCDFAVVTGDAAARARYVDALLAEIDLTDAGPLRFDTVYFGGGTPSALAPEQLERIVERLRARFAVADGYGVFLEANPEDVDESSARRWRDLGVTFLSLGVQSFDDGELRFLGRRHDGRTAIRAVEAARRAELPIVSLDLIYGLPGQTAEAWTRHLDRAVGLGVDHLSCYQLTFHAGTPFEVRRRRGGLTEMPNHAQADLFRITHERLSSLGLPAYEVSNFARSRAHRSAHNQKYWRHVPYLGLGPSAHSFVAGERFWNVRDEAAWAARIAAGESPVAGREHLDEAALALETVMLGLRTCDGIDLAAYEQRFGADLAALNADLIERLVAEGHLVTEARHLRPTTRGLMVADTLATELRPTVRCQPISSRPRRDKTR